MATLDLPDIVAALEYLQRKADMGKRVAEIAGQICRYARLIKYAKYDVSADISEALPDTPSHLPPKKGWKQSSLFWKA